MFAMSSLIMLARGTLVFVQATEVVGGGQKSTMASRLAAPISNATRELRMSAKVAAVAAELRWRRWKLRQLWQGGGRSGADTVSKLDGRSGKQAETRRIRWWRWWKVADSNVPRWWGFLAWQAASWQGHGWLRGLAGIGAGPRGEGQGRTQRCRERETGER